MNSNSEIQKKRDVKILNKNWELVRHNFNWLKINFLFIKLSFKFKYEIILPGICPVRINQTFNVLKK